jgi:1,2-diacylglycerol 3-alpha-glucosyltransferase
MSKLTIVFYTDSFLPARDGVVTSILNFRKELIRRGHKVYLFASGNSDTRDSVKGDGDVFVVKGIKFRKYPQYSLALLPFVSEAKLSQINPDIIHAHTPFIMGSWALASAKIEKIPVVSTFHTMFTDKLVIKEYAAKFAVNTLQRYSERYAKIFYSRCNGVIAPSESTKKELLKMGIENVYVVPNSIDMKRFNQNVNAGKIRKKLKRNRSEKIVLYLGRMSKEKRVEVLLKAARSMRGQNVRFVLAGTGPALEYYMRMAERMKLENVLFTGFVPDNEIVKYYAACDIFCIPSTFETQGIVCLEAMAMGKPVVGANKLALSDLIINGKNGEKFRPNDPKDCAKKIRKAINNTDAYKYTVKTAKDYSLEGTTDMLIDVYQKVIDSMTV